MGAMTRSSISTAMLVAGMLATATAVAVRSRAAAVAVP